MRKGRWVALVVFFAFCALFAAQKICSFDIWWHLKTGEWIWQNRAIPHHDPFSYTFQGAEWIDFEWLFQALIYPIWKAAGFGGLILFKVAVILLLFSVLFLACRRVDQGRFWLTLTLLFLALNVARIRFMVRPQIVFLLFVGVLVYLLISFREGKLSFRYFLPSVLLLQVLWVNFHSSFLMGLSLIGAHLLGRFISLAIKHREDLRPVFGDKRLRLLFLTSLLIAGFSLINPYSIKIYLVPIKTMGAKEVLRGIAEWVPIDIRILGLLVTDPTFWFRGMFLLGVFSFLIKKENLGRVEDLLIFVFFSYLAFRYHRFCGLFAVATAPVIVANLSRVRWQGRRWPLFVPLALIIFFSAKDLRGLLQADRLGLGVWRIYPESTVEFVKDHGVKGKIYNTYGLGGFLIFHLWPDVPVFIDGRTPTIYDQDFFWLYSLAERKKEIWEKVEEKYGIDMVLVRDERELGYSRLCYWLDEDEDWRLVAFDDKSVLYLKVSRFKELTEKWGFKYLRPSDFSMDYAKEKKGDEEYLQALGRELEEACRRFPRDFYPFYYLAVYHQIFGTREHLEKAEEALRRAISNRPHFARGYYELGFTLMKLERYKEAIRALRRAIKLQPNLPAEAYYYLGASYYKVGDMEEAIENLEEYRERVGLGARVEAYQFLGRAYLQKYKLRKALSCFERVMYLREPTWETYVNKGIAYFGLDQFQKARKCFEQAMEMKPDEIKIMYNLAVTYEKLGMLEEARKLFEKVTEMSPKTPEERTWIEKARGKLSGKGAKRN